MHRTARIACDKLRTNANCWAGKQKLTQPSSCDRIHFLPVSDGTVSGCHETTKKKENNKNKKNVSSKSNRNHDLSPANAPGVVARFQSRSSKSPCVHFRSCNITSHSARQHHRKSYFSNHLIIGQSRKNRENATTPNNINTSYLISQSQRLIRHLVNQSLCLVVIVITPGRGARGSAAPFVSYVST
jgi:hypothetical protein